MGKKETGPRLTMGACDTALKENLGHCLFTPSRCPLRAPQACKAPQQALRAQPGLTEL